MIRYVGYWFTQRPRSRKERRKEGTTKTDFAR